MHRSRMRRRRAAIVESTNREDRSPLASVVEALEGRTLLSLPPTGPEFLVNNYTTGVQDSTAMAIDSAGNFVIAWQSFGQPGGSSTDVYARRYNADGVAQGDEFRVNTYTTGIQSTPAVAMDSAGNVVIAWQGAGTGDTTGIHAQRFDAAGQLVGLEFKVNSYTTNAQTEAVAAMDDDGDFVVVWKSSGQVGGNQFDLYAQRFDSAGTAQGSEFRVNAYTTNHQQAAAVAMDASGDFVVAWTSAAGSYDVYARRFDATGVAAATEFRVNTFTTDLQFDVATAIDSDGDFVITWQSTQEVSSVGIYAQRYDSAGAAQGGEFLVNTYTPNNQAASSVGMSPDGDFVVSWASYGQDGSSFGVYAQEYNAAGVLQGGEFLVNTTTFNQQTKPVVARRAQGNYVIAWVSSAQDGEFDGVYAQRFGSAATGPSITASSFLFQTAPQKLTFTFDRDVSGNDPGDISIVDITLQKIGGGAVPSMTMLAYGTDGANVASFTMNTQLADGNYRATISAAGVTDGGDPMSENFVFDFFILGGDADHNRKVDARDLLILANNWLGSGKTFGEADFNYDGMVNQIDLTTMAQKWQVYLTPAPPPAQPLPGPAVPTAGRPASRTPTRTPSRAIDLLSN